MIARTFETVASYIARLKARRAKNVVDAFVELTSAQVAVLIPAALEFYRRGAHVVVEKTAENPQPLLALMDALRQTAEHYGPALAAEYAAFRQEHDALASSPDMVSREAAVLASLEELDHD